MTWKMLVRGQVKSSGVFLLGPPEKACVRVRAFHDQGERRGARGGEGDSRGLRPAGSLAASAWSPAPSLGVHKLVIPVGTTGKKVPLSCRNTSMYVFL